MKMKRGASSAKSHRTRLISKLLIAAVTFAALLFMCVYNIIPKKYNLKAGDVAPVNIKAPRDFVDDVETKKRIEKAVAALRPQYAMDMQVEKNSMSKIDSFFSLIKNVKSSPDTDEVKITRLKANTLISLSDDDCNEILKLDDSQITDLSTFLKSTVEKILNKGIRENNEEDLKNAQSDLNYYVQNSSMTRFMKDTALSAGINLLMPNQKEDKAKTEESIQQIKKDIGEVVIKKNQNIVLKGEVITEQNIQQMSKVGLLEQKNNTDSRIYFGTAMIILLMMTLMGAYLFKFKRDIFDNNQKLTIISIIILVGAGFTMGLHAIAPYIIPFSFIGILLTVIFEKETALAIGIPAFIIVALITNFNFDYTMIYIISCISSVIFVHNVHQRSSILFGGLCVGVVNAAVVFALGMTSTILHNLINSGLMVLGGLLSAVLAIGVLPVIESMFDIITPIKLLELSNPNQVLLKKMLFEAPGTYHHSILVGNLAEAAAGQIGANPLLARVGSYYHDIGKMKRPYFFKENQITNDNPHDKITPKLSTVIITSHVKDGIELAKEYNLPGAIKDIIKQHHGDTLVQYFYVRAKNESKEEIDESIFRYEGPRPTSREAAIVLLADSVEAAVRSLSTPTIDDIKNMVNKIVSGKIADGQLDNCQITFKDIVKIKESFVTVLEGIFHTRIEYPELNEAKDGKDGKKTNDTDRQ